MKTIIRNKMKHTILSIKKRAEVEKTIHSNLLQTEWWKNAKVIGLYYSYGFEWDTHALIDIALSQGKIVTLPRTNRNNRTMQFYQFENRASLENVYQDLWEPISTPDLRCEPNNHDLMIVPGLAFDKKGYRIGYGGGYYDRYLQHYQHRTVSLAHDVQVIDKIPINKYDQPIEMIITNTRLLVCT